MKNKESLFAGQVAIFAVVLLAFLFPVLFPQQLFWFHILALIFINIILCVSLRMMTLVGLLNLAIVAFMAIGAYSSAVVSTTLGVSFWLTMPMAGAICALLSLALGFPLLRLIGAYFFIGTVCVAMIVRVFFGNFFIGIFQGIPGFSPIAKPHLALLGLEIDFISKVSNYYLALILTAICVLILYSLEKSRYGRVWKAISQADNLSQSIGVDLFRYKMLNFAICSFFCGIAGAAFGAMNNIITPHDFQLQHVFFIVLFCIVGGMRSFWGPIIGAIFMGIIAEFLRTLGQWELLGYGIVLVLAVRFMPDGLIGLPKQLSSFFKRRIKEKELQKEMAPT